MVSDGKKELGYFDHPLLYILMAESIYSAIWYNCLNLCDPWSCFSLLFHCDIDTQYGDIELSEHWLS